MVAFATVDELAAFMAAAVPSERSAGATLALEIASAACQTYTRRDLVLVLDDVLDLSENNVATFNLPELPVWGASVSIDGVAIDATAYRLEPGGILRRLPQGTFGPTWPGDWTIGPTWDTLWGPPGSVVEVTYSHGYALTDADLPDPNPLGIQLLPADLKGVALKLAARLYDNPTGLQREVIQQYQVSYALNQLEDDDKRTLDHYRDLLAG
jgi:hypothetical protein